MSTPDRKAHPVVSRFRREIARVVTASLDELRVITDPIEQTEVQGHMLGLLLGEALKGCVQSQLDEDHAIALVREMYAAGRQRSAS